MTLFGHTIIGTLNSVQKPNLKYPESAKCHPQMLDPCLSRVHTVSSSRYLRKYIYSFSTGQTRSKQKITSHLPAHLSQRTRQDEEVLRTNLAPGVFTHLPHMRSVEQSVHLTSSTCKNREKTNAREERDESDGALVAINVVDGDDSQSDSPHRTILYVWRQNV